MGQKQSGDSHKGWKIFVRVMNVITALTLIGFGIAGIIVMSIKEILAFKFFLAFSPAFMILFGLVLLAADFKMQFINKHLKFLNSFMGRGIFNIYLSSTVFFYFSCGNDNDVVAWIAAIIIFVLGFIYCIMHCCCKDKNPDEHNDTKEQMM